MAPPPRIPLPFRLALWIATRRAGTDLLPARLLAWYPRAAIASGVLEALVAHPDGAATERVLKMVRMTVSFTVSCPFCIGMNSAGWEQLMTADELLALQGLRPLEEVPSLTAAERLAVTYARLISASPLQLDPALGGRLKKHFSERDIVVLATTAAQVNYWARLIQALGCPPTG
ncbi:MAG: carboxymuconolactone decarboxylase family protein [Methylobacterium sp.]|nr:MAG: carboxymuconolactone decarboxylase family protein [Methylobacterium sp.]